MASKKKQTVRPARRPGFYYYDYNLLACVILLTCFGLVMLYSTSAYQAVQGGESDMFYFGKQAAISAVCVVVMLIFSQFDYHFYLKFSGAAYVAANALLVITRFIGRESNGATRWIYIGPLSFQPAEFAKVAAIMYVTVVICKLGKNLKGVKAPLIVTCFGLFTSALTLVFTQNLSTAIIIAGITVAMVFVAHPKSKLFLAVAGGGLAALIIGIRLSVPWLEQMAESNFRLRRLLVWLDPEKYSAEGGYQTLQALYAIGSGGFFGKGLGNSTQKLSALPEAQNDMIFSIICEELGVFGAALLTLLFIFLLYRLLFIAQNAPDLAGSLMVTGIFAHIALQVMLNIMVVTNVIPNTGIILPFVSYGGTSIVFLMAEMTLALSVSRQIRLED